LAESDITEWYGRLEEAERFPDLGYWLSQDDSVKFAALWQMVIEAHLIKGRICVERDFRDLLAAFISEKVEYLIVGGYVVANVITHRSKRAMLRSFATHSSEQRRVIHGNNSSIKTRF